MEHDGRSRGFGNHFYVLIVVIKKKKLTTDRVQSDYIASLKMTLLQHSRPNINHAKERESAIYCNETNFVGAACCSISGGVRYT